MSTIFYEQLFCTKFICSTALDLKFSGEAALKMLVKLTLGVRDSCVLSGFLSNKFILRRRAYYSSKNHQFIL